MGPMQFRGKVGLRFREFREFLADWQMK